MSRLLDITLVLNIIGFAIISALESWRPGFVSGAVNMSAVWLVAVSLISGGVFFNKKTVSKE